MPVSSQRAVSHYETVAEYPPTPVVVELAQVLKLSDDELLGLAPPPKTARAPQDRETRRLWRKFQQVRALPAEDQRAVSRLVNSLVSAQAAR